MQKFIIFVEFLAAVILLLQLLSMCAPSGPPTQHHVPCCNGVTCWC